ncbi:hypothetical protein [Roseinatronobacter sp. S2]|uniref:hypothetical protein n=1 Tax=Roseinatronobacter sp. S2 TaxID=3035471 RepID=UPI00240EB2CB|nr:hypothetical protein [Roseinatronobacter sp. S2]WFE75742.1 hypothetical protein P8S53_04825 [Roseinatronobacter sp. S2]
MANPAVIRLPVHLPRDVWTRWPDMRSRRRYHGARAKDAAPGFGDPVLDGLLLGDFARDLRAGKCDGQTRTGMFGGGMAVLGRARRFAVICGIVVIAAALSVALLR